MVSCNPPPPCVLAASSQESQEAAERECMPARGALVREDEGEKVRTTSLSLLEPELGRLSGREKGGSRTAD